MSQHTPGPWEVKLSAGVRLIEVADKSDYQVATVNPFNLADEANARLIAAAPEMLDLIRELVDPLYLTTHTFRVAKALLLRLDCDEANPSTPCDDA